MPGEADELVEQIRNALPEHANPDRGRQQQAYMKSTMPHYGLQAPELKAVLKKPLSSHRLPDRESWENAIRSLWDEATHRELWYAALALARHRRYREWREHVESLSLWEHMIRTGAWWDVCDEISIHLVGGVLSANRAEVSPIMRQWARDDHLWIRRASILSQLRFKTATDTDLLTACITPSLSGRDFFSRKAIGWALREYSKTDPAWVHAFVEQHGEEMAPLSKREALRLLPGEDRVELPLDQD